MENTCKWFTVKDALEDLKESLETWIYNVIKYKMNLIKESEKLLCQNNQKQNISWLSICTAEKDSRIKSNHRLNQTTSQCCERVDITLT